MDFLCAFFEQTSRILHDLTDGAHSIGQVLFSINSMGGADADVWLHPNDDVWPNSTFARLWFTQEALDMSQDFMYYPTILAHELCHYLYALGDEYNNMTSCQDDITTEASIMEGYDWDVYTRWTDAAGNEYPDWATFWADFLAGTAVLQLGQPTEFCHSGNHNATANNNQNIRHNNQSCWTTIADDTTHNNIPYSLTAPGAGGPILAPPAPPPTVVTCTELIPVQRFMLILDRSYSMVGTKIEQLKVGANFWVDYVNPNEELGIVTYSTTPTLDTPMSEVPSDPAIATTWRNNRHNDVDAIIALGSTAIGDALRIGLNDITAGGRASSQVMILFTDGLQNTGTETAEQVLPDIVAAGVRVYTIGLGNDQNAALLSDIATTSGASYFAISGDLNPTDAATAISDALIQIAGESRENGGIVSFNDVDPAAADEIGIFGLPFDWVIDERRKPIVKRMRSFRFPVEISQGSSHCTLGVKWNHPQRQFRVKIRDPTGAPVSSGPSVRHIEAKYQYSFYEIENPKAGTWQVIVAGQKLSETRFRTIGFEVNNRIRFEVTAKRSHIRRGMIITLRARILAPQAIPGAKLLGWIYSPSGRLSKVPFVEHTEDKGDTGKAFTYSASIKTNKIESGQYLICVDMSREKGVFEFKLDELYRRKPGLRRRDIIRKVPVPSMKRRKFLSVVASPEGPHKQAPRSGYNTKDPWVPQDQKEHVLRWKKKHPDRY